MRLAGKAEDSLIQILPACSLRRWLNWLRIKEEAFWKCSNELLPATWQFRKTSGFAARHKMRAKPGAISTI